MANRKIGKDREWRNKYFWAFCLAAVLAFLARGFTENPLVTITHDDGNWEVTDTALARAPARELVIFTDIDPEGQYNDPVAYQHRAIQARVQNIDANNTALDADEAALELLLALGVAVGLPRQIERDEENMIRRPPASLVGDLASEGELGLEASSAVFVAQGSAVIRSQQNETANLDRRLVEVPELDAVHDIDDERLPALPSGVGLPRVAAMDLGVSARAPQHLPTTLPAPAIDGVDAPVLELDAIGALLPETDAVDPPAPAPEIVAVDAPVLELDAIGALLPEIDAVDAPAPAPEIVAVDAPVPEIVAGDAPAAGTNAIDALYVS